MAYEDIIVERTATALEITLNRPEKLNALREKTAAEIMEAMGEVEMDRRHQRVQVCGQRALRRLSRAQADAEDAADDALRHGLHQACHHRG
jgi:enoyl-CoA hydratase/carnithine racemase